MPHAFRLTAEKIGKRIALVRPHVRRTHAPIAPFTMEVMPDASTPPAPRAPDDVPMVGWSDYWAGADTHFVLRSRFTVPESYAEPALHLPLGVAGDIFTHPEALLHINGRAVASADRYHHTIPLDPALADGREHELMLHGWTGLTGWPPDRTQPTKLQMRECSVVDLDRDLEALCTLAEAALETARALDENRTERHDLLAALDAAFLALDTRDPLGDALHASAPDALHVLREGIAAAGAPLNVTLHGIGHAHMDIAYLWPIEQIRQKSARTSSNVLRLMERHPEFTFSHSQPQLYEWTRTDFPDIFEAISKRVAEGRWEVLGGMWVEPDANMPGGEALVRQIMLSREWTTRHYGPDAETPVLWLPDTFGFPASLPQIMAQAGIEWFVTNKVSWNQYNRMPASTTWWEGIDGSRVLAHFLTTPRPVQHLPFPTNYKSELTAAEVIGTWEESRPKGTVRDLPICYGYGDGGGGPTEDLIGRATAFAAMPGAPRLKPSTVRETFEAIERVADELPTWSGELYLEGHRGVLTSQGWIKRANRMNEALLHDAEWLAALATLHGHAPPDLREAWRLLCVNQFHDIITGTSVAEAFEDARRDHAEIEATARAAIADALGALPVPADTTHRVADGAPLGVSRTVLIEGTATGFVTSDGSTLPTQPTEGGTLVALPDVGGYAVHDLAASDTPSPPPEHIVGVREDGDGIVIENRWLRVTIGPDGTLHLVHDREADREALAPGEWGNVLQAFEDRPISWDAWDIDAFYEERAETINAVHTIEIFERGPLRAVIRVERRWRSSVIVQRIVMTHASRRIDFQTEIDWHESHVLLKAAFPVAVRAPNATYEIQFGHIERPTHRNTSWDAARFEVCAHRWADLSEADYGVALLNDGRYGHDVRGHTMRLSLVKSATMPDPGADQGRHAFTYALLPHAGDWRADVAREAYALNHPPHVRPVLKGVPTVRQSGPADTTDFAGMLVQCTAPNVVMETVKPAADGDGTIVRLYEAWRTRGQVTLALGPDVRSIARCGLLEEKDEPLDITNRRAKIMLLPHEIATLRLRTHPCSNR